MTGRRDARPTSPRPRSRWRLTSFSTAAAMLVVSAPAFMFCVIAATRPGIAVSAIVMAVSAVVLNLTAGDGE